MCFRRLWVVILALSSGCVTVYQPLQTLQRPVVVDLDEANFDGLKVEVRCPPGTFVKGGDAQRMCRRVQRVFANQGANVEPVAPTSKPDLIIDIQSRLLHSNVDTFMSLLCIASLTLVPAMSEASLAADVTIRDGEGFVLASDSFQARFINYFGFGVWAINGILDLFFRAPNEKLTGNSQNKEVSRDFYSQLSQLAFHARTRALVLRGFEQQK